MDSEDKVMAIFIICLFLVIAIIIVTPFVAIYKDKKIELETKRIELQLKQLESEETNENN